MTYELQPKDIFPCLQEKKLEIKDFKETLYDRLANKETGKIKGCPNCFPRYHQGQLCEFDCLPDCDWSTFYFYQTNAQAQLDHLNLTLESDLEVRPDTITSRSYWDAYDKGVEESADNLRSKVDAILTKDLQLDYFDICFAWVQKTTNFKYLAQAYYSMASHHCHKKYISGETEMQRAFNKLWYDNRVAIINLVSQRIHDLIPNASGFKEFEFIESIDEEDLVIKQSSQLNEALH